MDHRYKGAAELDKDLYLAILEGLHHCLEILDFFVSPPGVLLQFELAPCVCVCTRAPAGEGRRET